MAVNWDLNPRLSGLKLWKQDNGKEIACYQLKLDLTTVRLVSGWTCRYIVY
jgi:hypothetical protein